MEVGRALPPGRTATAIQHNTLFFFVQYIVASLAVTAVLFLAAAIVLQAPSFLPAALVEGLGNMPLCIVLPSSCPGCPLQIGSADSAHQVLNLLCG